MLTVAIEAEVSAFIEQHNSLKTEEVQTTVVRNRHLLECSIQIGLGDITVNLPKIRDRSGASIKLSFLVPTPLHENASL